MEPRIEEAQEIVAATDIAAHEQPARPGNNLATASLAIGIISIFLLSLLTVGAVVGLIIGAVALAKARRDPAHYGGGRIALAGMITNGVSIVLWSVLSPLIFFFIVQPVKVEGMAMTPALKNGDRILVWKQIDSIKRGDIVVFWYPKDPSKSFIKRVVGLPGETLSIDKSGTLFIDGRAAAEPYLSPEYNHYPRPVPDTFVEPHYYFVMGDNRDASNDSRSWGLVPEKYIYGKVALRYYSAK